MYDGQTYWILKKYTPSAVSIDFIYYMMPVRGIVMSTVILPLSCAGRGNKELAKEIAESVSVPKVIPIYMSSVFSFDDVPTLDSVYEGKKSGYVYSRMANPGLDAAQDVLRAAEGSDGAIVLVPAW